jgi:glucose/arabinose dehydrogenase
VLAIVGLGAMPACSEAPDRLVLPPGFEASVFHEGVGTKARHIVVRAGGDVFVSRRDGMLVALRDADGDGRAEQMETRRLPITTGLALGEPHLYFADQTSVSRIRLGEGLLPEGPVETIVSGFPKQRAHATKSIVLGGDGALYVNVGAPSNACQEQQRSPGSPGMRPCPQLEWQAAIWRFTTEPGQHQRDGERYVTGTRNVVAMDWNANVQALYFAIHGRDQLGTLWPELFDEEDNAEMPAEELHRAVPGASYGWPDSFVDPRSGRRLLAPEYGGDGEMLAQPGRHQSPLHAYPAHWAPNDLLVYTGQQFPEAYRGGVFIAWRGSWNRAPRPQAGYRVTFQPLAEGEVAGPPIDFVRGFEGRDRIQSPSQARYRPGGLALGPDGSLYVVEQKEGRIWRIQHRP